MYIWNLKNKVLIKIKYIILADIGILSLIEANFQVLEVDLVKQSW